MKQKIEFSDNVSETLLIPLWMRATDPVLRDEHSLAIVKNIDYGFGKFSVDKGSRHGVRIRTLYLGQVIQDFINSHKNAVIVSLGCGLDPQSRRVTARSNALFYAIDLPDVIELRRRFLSETDYERYIAESVLDTAWMERLSAIHAEGAQFLFIAEGLLMYFTEGQNRKLVNDLAEHFPGAELYLERMSRLVVKNQSKHKSVSKTAAKFLWGANSPAEVCAWRDSIKVIADYKYLPHAKGLFGLVGRLVPPLGNSCGIYGLKL